MFGFGAIVSELLGGFRSFLFWMFLEFGFFVVWNSDFSIWGRGVEIFVFVIKRTSVKNGVEPSKSGVIWLEFNPFHAILMFGFFVF